MPYKLDESRNATNFTPGADAGRGAPTEIVIHHWGVDGQTHDGVVNWFCTPDNGCQTSAHFVASANRAHCIVSPSDVAWHAGNWAVNLRSIGIECRPEATDGDYQTVAELIRWLRGLYGDLPLRPHKKYALTDCPGRYDLARLDKLARGAAPVKPQGTTTPIPAQKDWFDTMNAAEQKALLDAAAKVNRYLDAPIGVVPGKVATAVWSTPVSRDGKHIGALQELADAKTEGMKANAQIAALQNVIAQLAGGSAIDYGKVTEAVTAALRDGTVQVDVTVAGGK